jgi:hypothetical protein
MPRHEDLPFYGLLFWIFRSPVYSESGRFGHLVDVEHMVSRRLLTNATGDMVCKDVTSLMVPKPF